MFISGQPLETNAPRNTAPIWGILILTGDKSDLHLPSTKTSWSHLCGTQFYSIRVPRAIWHVETYLQLVLGGSKKTVSVKCPGNLRLALVHSCQVLDWAGSFQKRSSTQRDTNPDIPINGLFSKGPKKIFLSLLRPRIWPKSPENADSSTHLSPMQQCTLDTYHRLHHAFRMPQLGRCWWQPTWRMCLQEEELTCVAKKITKSTLGSLPPRLVWLTLDKSFNPDRLYFPHL